MTIYGGDTLASPKYSHFTVAEPWSCLKYSHFTVALVNIKFYDIASLRAAQAASRLRSERQFHK